MGQPMMFQSPYRSTTPPDHCCCGNGSGVTVNVDTTPNDFPALDNDGGTLSRTDQAARIIDAANAEGFPVFQGS